MFNLLNSVLASLEPSPALVLTPVLAMATLTTDPHGRLTKAQVEVLLVLDDDSGQYVAYCPALEVSSYGDTEEEARAAFEDALAIFIKDTTERGTLDQFVPL